MKTVLLLNWQDLRQFTDVNNAVDSKLIQQNIREAQDIELQRIIGTLLYNRYITDIEEGNPIEGAYNTLLTEYIQYFLLYASYHRILESIYIRPKNNGLLTPQGGDNSNSVDTSTYNSKRTSVQNTMEYYADRLAKYITEEQASFTELNQNTLLYQQVPDYGSQYRSPIIFKDTTRARYLNLARKSGLPIVDSAFPQYPPKYNK